MDTLTFGPLASRIPLYRAGDDFSAVPNLQPYFKLHGSIDIQSDRNLTLVLGGDKEAEIDKHLILRAYHDQFRWRLNLPNARLMVIGYSFADHHINKIIFEAAEKGLKIFIVDPAGAMLVTKIPNYNPSPKIKAAIVGASSRPLRNTLSGKDMVELMKIERFFQDGRMASVYQNPPL